MLLLFWLYRDINLAIISNKLYVAFELLTLAVIFINLVAIHQTKILIIDNDLDTQIGKSIYLKVNFLPFSKNPKPNCFFQKMIVISHRIPIN